MEADKYVNAYAHSNLHEALLASMYAFVIGNERDPEGAFFELRNQVASYLKYMTLPAEDDKANEVRTLALGAIAGFFGDVGDILVSRQKLKTEHVTKLRRTNSYEAQEKLTNSEVLWSDPRSDLPLKGSADQGSKTDCHIPIDALGQSYYSDQFRLLRALP